MSSSTSTLPRPEPSSIQTEATPTVPAEQPVPLGNGYAPISMKYIFWTSFLISYIYGALLFCLNWRRLGKPERFTRWFIAWGVLLVLVVWVSTVVSAFLNLPSIVSIYLAGLAVGLVLVWWQRTAFNDWMYYRGERRATLKRYGPLTAIGLIIGTSISIAVVFIFTAPFAVPVMTSTTSLANSLIPMETSRRYNLEISYPGSWDSLAWDDLTSEAQATCEQTGITCIFSLVHHAGGSFVRVLRSGGLDRFRTAQQLDGLVVNQWSGQGAKLLSQTTLQLNGRPAYQSVLQWPSGAIDSMTFSKEASGDAIIIQARFQDQVVFDIRRDEVTGIISSFRSEG